MQYEKTPASKELKDADTALRRAAQTAKKLAEQNGTPYIVAEVSASRLPQDYPDKPDKNDMRRISDN